MHWQGEALYEQCALPMHVQDMKVVWKHLLDAVMLKSESESLYSSTNVVVQLLGSYMYWLLKCLYTLLILAEMFSTLTGYKKVHCALSGYHQIETD